jgi:hypothetical protein
VSKDLSADEANKSICSQLHIAPRLNENELVFTFPRQREEEIVILKAKSEMFFSMTI